LQPSEPYFESSIILQCMMKFVRIGLSTSFLQCWGFALERGAIIEICSESFAPFTYRVREQFVIDFCFIEFILQYLGKIAIIDKNRNPICDGYLLQEIEYIPAVLIEQQGIYLIRKETCTLLNLLCNLYLRK